MPGLYDFAVIFSVAFLCILLASLKLIKFLQAILPN